MMYQFFHFLCASPENYITLDCIREKSIISILKQVEELAKLWFIDRFWKRLFGGIIIAVECWWKYLTGWNLWLIVTMPEMITFINSQKKAVLGSHRPFLIPLSWKLQLLISNEPYWAKLIFLSKWILKICWVEIAWLAISILAINSFILRNIKKPKSIFNMIFNDLFYEKFIIAFVIACIQNPDRS